MGRPTRTASGLHFGLLRLGHLAEEAGLFQLVGQGGSIRRVQFQGTPDPFDGARSRRLLPASTASLGLSWRMQTPATLSGCCFTKSP